MSFASKIGVAAIFAIGLAMVPAAASATGTINIHRANGDKNTYRDVEIKIFAGAIFLTSDDGDGTIVVTQAACSYQGMIMVCLPIAAALVQEGDSNALNLKAGTVYFNYSKAPQTLARSTTKLPSGSILLALTLRDGTFIDARGKIDEVVER